MAEVVAPFQTGDVEANDYATLAMQLMAEHQIAPTPKNFSVWYSFAAGDNPELTKTMNILISGGRDFNESWCDDLYARFCGDAEDLQEISRITENVEKSLEEVVSNLDAAGIDTRKFGNALGGVHDILASNDAQALDLGAIVGTLVSATRHMQRRSEVLEQRLQQSSAQIVELRDDLETVRAEAMTDMLTGLANRKAFEHQLREEAMASMEEGSDLCLLLGDIDHFKTVNDSWGHQVGDNVLILVAECIKDFAGPEATCARYGGEEFAIILPGANVADAVSTGDRIREALADKKIRKRTTGEDIGSITMSFGVAQYVFGEVLADLVERADNALYTAKSRGRNRVVANET